MVYTAAIIGCHGVGKTTLVKKLENNGFKAFEEGAINEFMGFNYLLSEIKVIMNRVLINKEIKKYSARVISDRCTFIDALIYSHAFHKLGWINEKELNTIYSVVNNLDYSWEFPEILLCMTNTKEAIMNNIKKRGRHQNLREFNEDYLNVVYELYNDFFLHTFDFPMLRSDLRNKIKSIPKVFFKHEHELKEILGVINSEDSKKNSYCLK